MRRGVTLLLAGLLLGILPRVAGAATLGYEPHSVLVGFEGISAAARAKVHAAVGGKVLNRFDWIDVDVVRLPRGIDPPEGVRRYERRPGVKYAEPNWVVRIDSVPNDPSFDDLWGMDNTGQVTQTIRSNGTCCDVVAGNGAADVNAPQGWDLAFGTGVFESTGGTRVGIIDTGIDQAHADLSGLTKVCAQALSGNGTVSSGGCADDHGHGTHVAGTIAAHADNGLGVAGVAPNAELAIVKTLKSNGEGFVADSIGAVNYLRTTGGARVINMSLGGDESSTSESNAMASAYSAGVLLIASAGNDFDSSVEYPAGYPDVVSVASIDAADRHSTFSNTNADVEIAAPGDYILSTVPGGGYQYMSGTSMAAPHVAGLAAMVMSELGYTHSQTRTRLQESATDLGSNGRDSLFGYGRVNLQAAIAGAPPVITAPSEGAFLSSASVTITGSAPASTTVAVKEGASTIGTTTASGTGAWSVAATFSQGPHTITATATTGSQTSPPVARTFTVDSVAPGAPVITSPAQGAVVNSRNVSIGGTAEAGALVTVKEGASTLGTATAVGTGTWSLTATMTEAAHSVIATATDAAGNAGPASAPRAFSIDAPPPPPVITSPAEGSSIAGPTLPVSGTAQPGSTVALKEGATSLGSAVAAANGSWSVTATFANGSHTINATATDSGGTSPQAVRSFATGNGPSMPIVLTPQEGSFNGSAVLVSGTAGLGTSIRITEGTTILRTLATRSDGKWSTTLAFADGDHTIGVAAIDVSGTASPAALRTFVVDGARPSVTFTMTSPSVQVLNATLSGEGTDNRGVTRIEIEIYRANSLITREDARCDGCAPFARSVAWTSTPALLPGAYTVYATAYDRAGNKSPRPSITLILI